MKTKRGVKFVVYREFKKEGGILTVVMPGCKTMCNECDKRELWDAKSGYVCGPADLAKDVAALSPHTVIFEGGELLQVNANELMWVMEELEAQGFKGRVFVTTCRETITDLKRRAVYDPATRFILEHVHVIRFYGCVEHVLRPNQQRLNQEEKPAS